MELFSAALPNIMFVAGIVAIAIGLGIELKVVPVGNQVGRGGRIGAMTVGVLLVIVSVVLYVQPQGSTTASSPTATAAAVAAIQPSAAPVQQGIVAQATAAPEQPTAAATATTAAEPTATAAPPTTVPPTAVPGVAVPDTRGKGLKDADKQLLQLGLKLERHDGSCADLQVSDDQVRNGKKDTIACQQPPAGAEVAPGTVIKVVLTDQKRK